MKKKKLCIFLTAGFPKLDSTAALITLLNQEGVDYIEVGMPYSDPLADGLTIQHTSKVALENGMQLDILFSQLESVRGQGQAPLIYMGYINQVLSYGMERFIDRAMQTGIKGCILPDLPMELYERKYIELFREKGMGMNFLVSPGTSDERILQADRLSDQYLYIISQNTITGTPKDAGMAADSFFERLNSLPLTSEKLIGFGIKDRSGVERAYQFADGAIIGSAFLQAINGADDLDEAVRTFIRSVR